MPLSPATYVCLLHHPMPRARLVFIYLTWQVLVRTSLLLLSLSFIYVPQARIHQEEGKLELVGGVTGLKWGEK